MDAKMNNGSIKWISVSCVVALMVCGEVLAQPQQASKGTSKKAPAKAAKTSSGRAALPNRSADPYLGAIVVDAATGQVLVEKNADAPGFPASVIKLMDMMVIMDRLASGQLSLSNAVTVTAEASKVGGSQVYLAEKEVFTLEDLMYALMVQSANDSAVAIALHVAGGTAGFVDMMNGKAAELGMTNTQFHSVHGLPPAAGKSGDTSTARDLATLARALIDRHPDILKYTSAQMRPFRGGKFIMRSHNHLLSSVAGCDGMKTGYITAGGFSIVATAQRGGRRVIAVVLGSRDRKVRDAAASELLSKGFAALPPLPPPPPPKPAVTNEVVTHLPPAPLVTEESSHSGWLKVAGIGLLAGLAVLGLAALMMKRRNSREF
jgi:D-alanyl-D-alanine carboxypeptidase (penicillin-binding protein 5/6)